MGEKERKKKDKDVRAVKRVLERGAEMDLERYETEKEGREIKLSRVGSVLEELSYPISNEDAANELYGTTVLLADGEADLGAITANLPSDSFESADELETELFSSLPMEAIGEPGQSEGEGD